MKHRLYFFTTLIIICIFVYSSLANKARHREPFQNDTCDVPKNVWCYWNSTELPPIIATLTNCWKSNLKSWNVNIITPSTIDEYLSKEVQAKKPTNLGPAHFADWLRLYLLRDHGGVWIDASTIIDNEQALDRYYDEFCKSGKELFGFYAPSKWYQTLPDMPVLENYFLMSRPNSPFVKQWCDEFQHAVNIGFARYREEITVKGIDPQKLGNYHTQHICAQKIMQTRGGNPHDYLLIYNATDHVFYHINDERKGYNRDNLQKELLDPSFRREHPILKLIANDRALLNHEEFVKNYNCAST